MTYEFKSASSAKIGKKFKEKRIELGFSIIQMSEKLFINKDYLNSIEEGDYSIFPSESFARAYFKKYMEYLNIENDFPSVFEKNLEKKHKKISKEIRFNSSSGKNFIYISIFTLIALSIFAYFLTKTPVIDEKIPVNQIIPFKDITVIYETVKQNKSIVISDNNTNILNNLVLEFIDECWIELYLDEKLIEAQNFNSGDQYSKVLKPPFKIIIGNSDSVKGTYNGEYIDFITNANRLTKVNIIYFLNE